MPEYKHAPQPQHNLYSGSDEEYQSLINYRESDINNNQENYECQFFYNNH